MSEENEQKIDKPVENTDTAVKALSEAAEKVKSEASE
jgi:hypothetical protein